MSSSEAKPSCSNAGVEGTVASRRTFVRGIAASTLTIGLAACADGSGFRPLYGSLGSGPRLEQKLAQVQISTIPGRGGQRLRNELLFHTTGGGSPLPPNYRLEIALKESTTSSLVLSNGSSAAQLVQMVASFQLIRLKDRKVLVTGSSESRANFERSANVFSNVRSADEAQERAAKVIATDLRARVSAVLATEKA